MRSPSLVAFTIASFLGVTTARAQVADAAVHVPLIVSSARGEIRVTPDRATITLSVQTRAASASDAASENARRQTAVIAALRSAGVRDSQISTQDYAITPETRYDKGGQAPRIVSYLVTNGLAVRTSASAKIGALVDAALAAGANQISAIDFSASNSQELYQKAVASAVTNARAQAVAMAAAAGGHLGSLVEIVSNDAGWIPPGPRPMSGIAMAAVETPILSGPEIITASVTARWTFVPDR